MSSESSYLFTWVGKDPVRLVINTAAMLRGFQFCANFECDDSLSNIVLRSALSYLTVFYTSKAEEQFPNFEHGPSEDHINPAHDRLGLNDINLQMCKEIVSITQRCLKMKMHSYSYSCSTEKFRNWKYNPIPLFKVSHKHYSFMLLLYFLAAISQLNLIVKHSFEVHKMHSSRWWFVRNQNTRWHMV